MVYEPSEDELGRIAQAIGALFLNFSALEHALSLAVAATLELSDVQERSLVRGMMARAKLDLLDAYAKTHWEEDDQKTTIAITARARTVTNYRNDFAHGVISHDREGDWAVVSYRGKHRFHGIPKPFTVVDVLDKAGEAETVAIELQALGDAIRERPPSKSIRGQ